MVDLVEALAILGGVTKRTAIDSTYVKAHRSIHYDERRYKDRHLVENAFYA